MKAILMSIKHKWCELIFSGDKTIEVRKTAPKLYDTPFKVYVYETKYRLGNKFIDEVLNTVYDGGKVIGEFVCDDVITMICAKIDVKMPGVAKCERYSTGTCLTAKELYEYSKGDWFCGWHITAPKLYDTPKELSEFWTVRCINKKGECKTCEVKPACINYITRPPQSWCYVEEIEE